MSTRLFFNRIKYLLLRLAGTKYIVTECVPYGLKMKFLLRDGQCRDIYYKYGVYSEDHINRYLVDHLNIKTGDLIIDIGANIGWYSLVLSMKEKPTIVAFEPDTVNFALLTENLRMNNRTNVKAYNKAVSDHEGTLTLYLYKTHNPGRHSFIKQKNSVGTAEVPIVPLDKFLAQEGYGEGPVKLVKIDIEGYEYTALKAASNMLARAEYILAEFSPYMMRDIGQDPMDYVRLLQNAGFTLKVIEKDGLHEPDYENIIAENQQVNFLGRKESK